ncbi:MAG: PIN domain nuclease [Archaeoglobales archaeon]|nr:MAG: PIN domain nuclease [Archaeoglobales archaeon]
MIIDASIAVKWFINEKYSDRALKLLEFFKDGKIELHAPEILKVEVANALRKYFARGFVKESHVEESLNILSNIDITYHEISWNLLKKSLNYSILNPITVYDALYILLSKDLNLRFITADEKLFKALKEKENIILLKNWP